MRWSSQKMLIIYLLVSMAKARKILCDENIRRIKK